ncbi:MAG TPA: hypothetical protein VGM97_12330 [Steroidobacteraceae bacterium]
MSMPETDKSIPVPRPAPPPAGQQESFVINLCSSTTPMALTQPQLAQLKHFSFFVSRRLEDGRERFRLHMGYFDSLLQAEEMLPVVRDLYPGAWAGEAPGKRLRARAAAEKPAAVVSPAVPAAPMPVAPKPVAPPKPVAAKSIAPEGPSAELLAKMPTLSAAPEPTPTPPPPAPITPPPAPVTAPLVLELLPQPARVAPAAPIAELDALIAAAPVSPAPPPVAAPPAAHAPSTKRTAAAVPFDQRSNVREVLSALDESARKPALPVAPSGPVVRQPGVLPESQVLHLLEEKRGDPLNTVSTPAAFSIQLQWSVQPIDLAKVPPLAIFGAYTLYTVEGSREGRRWFGLRLGFFKDANSAKQVAQYVRSEFSSVAVVPVSLKERDGASGATGGTGVAAAAAAAAPQRPTERLPDQSAEFKLWDDTGSTPPPVAAEKAPAAAADKSAVAKPKTAAAGKLGAPGRAGQKGTKSRRGRVNAHERRSPQTLEETLEILGAGELQIEGGRKELISEGQIRHIDVKVQKNSPFTRLLDRLAERGR